jgi:hypothetical protein
VRACLGASATIPYFFIKKNDHSPKRSGCALRAHFFPQWANPISHYQKQRKFQLMIIRVPQWEYY